ncbi:stemmadenine O-acetyltransferase-like [Benincasa hispida]|uniref:stemmadenine O-acetyltransferase-like n=1 Tax=Benincasa hispida TaxID=102211 RepID=UPI0019018F47|nr:stemmadenine O-acetyltransferase-like [Benincasa hispida]
MENINVEIISMDIIKPSSSTPDYCQLSLIDQMAPPSYMPAIFFYPPQESENLAHQSLKAIQIRDSLSRTLTRFYPLAGTMVERFYVDCNDAGVSFSESKLDCEISLLLNNPEIRTLHCLLPLVFTSNSADSKFLLAIQFNRFSCGGVAVAVCVSHKLADGASAAGFVKAWAADARGGSNSILEPNFDAAKLFPCRKIPGFKRGIEASKEKISTKRLVFSKSDIDVLKSLAVNTDGGSAAEPPSRVVAVSAFLWLRLMALARTRPVKAKVFGALYPVDLRTRMDPPLPENSFGNVSWFTIATSPVEINEDLPLLVAKVRTAIQEIDSGFVKKLEDSEHLLDLMKQVDKQLSSGEIYLWSFTSWCRFPVYEADFGWGKPTWVCSPSRPFRNAVVLMDTSDGDGVEAWVNLKEEDMAIFEKDEELLSFCSD